MQHLEDLLSAGYGITFTSPLKDVYEAVLSGPDGDAMRGTGDSPGEALWAVSPFHAPRAPYPAVPLEETVAALAESAGKLHLTAAAISALWEEAQGRAVSALDREVRRAVHALEKRVDALETEPIDGDRVVVTVPVCGAEGPPALAGYRCRLPEGHGGDEHEAAGCTWWKDPAARAEQDRHVKITVTGDCGHVIGTWTDKIAEKYPFWCEQCDTADCEADKRTGSYPWELTTEVIRTA